MKAMSELKPCPFCGSENIAVGSDKGTVYRRNTAFGDLTRSVPTVRWAYCVDCGCVAPAEKVNNFDGFYKPDEQEDALDRAISAWNRRAQPANEPLTLEQLREMDGEPVWTVNVSSTKDGTWEMWDIVEKSDDEGIEFGYSTEYKEWWNYNLRNSDGTLCGCFWLAYRRPPERSENDG